MVRQHSQIEKLLKERLTDSEAECLDRLCREWDGELFCYSPRGDAFETSESWDLNRGAEETDEAIELVIKCCAILNEAKSDVAETLTKVGATDKGTFELHFVFSIEPDGVHRDDIEVGEVFLNTLKRTEDYRVDMHELPAGTEVTVGFDFHSDLDFSRKKEHVYALLEGARKKRWQRLFQGRRL